MQGGAGAGQLSAMRSAARPVGAASATSGAGWPACRACAASSSNRLAMVVVLPVPGPPVTSASGCRRVTPAARAW
ncbi:hypothetical protein G6F58_013779 [Rhizopus delemar]|nr:hypothetical protein G6F58_013779 [Rhizopus delemar]